MRRYGCLFMLTCHPFLSGRPGGSRCCARVIEHALDGGDVEFVDVPRGRARAVRDPATERRS